VDTRPSRLDTTVDGPDPRPSGVDPCPSRVVDGPDTGLDGEGGAPVRPGRWRPGTDATVQPGWTVRVSTLGVVGGSAGTVGLPGSSRSPGRRPGRDPRARAARSGGMGWRAAAGPW
jgi:hypothetical protein